MATLISFCGRFPVLGTDNGQADLALLINVGVVDPSLECDLQARWFGEVRGGI